MKCKVLCAVCIILILLVSLTACSTSSTHSYNVEWILGKNSNEVIEKYGEFDHVGTLETKDGLYCNTVCSYIIEPAKVGFLGTTPEQLFSISFDESGIAYRCFEEVGGKGG